MKHKKILIIICLIVFIIGSIIYSKEKSYNNSNVPKGNIEKLDFFKENVDYEEIITCSIEDINNDSEKDLLVVYKYNNKQNKMVAVIKEDTKMYITDSVLAPKEDVAISFKNIDEKDEIEVMLSGSKNGSFGYAIYRLDERKLIDLFGEGMDACC